MARIYAKDLGLSDEEFDRRMPVIAQMEPGKRAAALSEIQAETKMGRQKAEGLSQKIGDIEQIASDKYIKGAVGPSKLTRVSPFSAITGGKQDFIASVEQLSNQEVLDTLTDLKAKGGTLGALNEKEMEVLQNAATKINRWAERDESGKVTGYNTTEKSFKQELDRIKKLSSKAQQQTAGFQSQTGQQAAPAGDIESLRSKYNY